MSVCCSILETVSLICKNLWRSCEPDHAHFGGICHAWTGTYTAQWVFQIW